MGENHEDKREFPRISVKLSVTVKAGEKILVEGTLKDLSIKGFYCAAKQKVPIGSLCETLIALGDEEGLPKIQIKGLVVREGIDGFAVQFRQDSVDSLKMLMTLFSDG